MNKLLQTCQAMQRTDTVCTAQTINQPQIDMVPQTNNYSQLTFSHHMCEFMPSKLGLHHHTLCACDLTLMLAGATSPVNPVLHSLQMRLEGPILAIAMERAGAAQVQAVVPAHTLLELTQ